MLQTKSETFQDALVGESVVLNGLVCDCSFSEAEEEDYDDVDEDLGKLHWNTNEPEYSFEDVYEVEEGLEIKKSKCKK